MVAKLKQRHLKGYFVKTLLFKASLVTGAMLVSIAGQAQQSAAGQAQQSTKAAPKSEAFQALCRVKAKESANLAFKSCMSENKSAEIESIRKGYQERLEQIKAQYEEELGKVSGKHKAVTPSQEFKQPAKTDESQLLKNAILEDATDEIQESSYFMERKNSDETDSGRFIEKSAPEKKEIIRDTQLPKAPAFTETASRNDSEKREPKEPQFPPKSKRTTISLKNQIAAATKTKAILFNDMTDAPEPIPVEAMNQPLGHNN